MKKAEIGLYGIGTMGRALALNFAENGVSVVVGNRELDQIAAFIRAAGPLAERIRGTERLEDLVAGLQVPRTVLFMIPSGDPVDQMIAQLAPLLEPGDTIIDGGNADFHDTRRRSDALAAKGLHFVGMGVSGGEEGARHGPSMMVGGSDDSWRTFRPMAEKIAAKYGDFPCVAHVGPDGAGHFVKTVHNGIEYADMGMIAEIYGLLRDGAGWEAARIGALFGDWTTGPLASFLVEVTAHVLATTDRETGLPLVDLIRDTAGQKGTGRWTVIEALHLGQSASAIEAAVAARNWSSEAATRAVAADVLSPGGAAAARIPSADVLAGALRAGRILAHAQGFRILRAASVEYGWSLDPAQIADIWRAGCIIRSDLLNEIAGAFRAGAPEGELVLSPAMQIALAETVPGLRATVGAAVAAGLPVPGLAAALGWYDSLRQARGTANLIQAQRDFFGAHRFERTDGGGPVHADWASGEMTG
ncbi:NADP-dependent phosphogluconate dehydrogenase [Chachezhania sediminis]|uniref:NADP-dependent phosphogluconate dehydrogenase n=1 Tax=Chachezhania sediminis TaxID=2599291 RepID=UPI00131C24CD|nr:NADP-dependent phosphogluconate dehydrogenase [Chachezhania sediminis]